MVADSPKSWNRRDSGLRGAAQCGAARRDSLDGCESRRNATRRAAPRRPARAGSSAPSFRNLRNTSHTAFRDRERRRLRVIAEDVRRDSRRRVASSKLITTIVCEPRFVDSRSARPAVIDGPTDQRRSTRRVRRRNQETLPRLRLRFVRVPISLLLFPAAANTHG